MTTGTIPKPTKSQKSYAEAELEKRRESLRKKGKTNKDIKRIEKTMLEKGIFTHDKASEYLDWMDQAKKPLNKKVNEINDLKNLIARQDDVIEQLQEQIKASNLKTGELGQECEDLEDKIDTYREIIKSIMEVTDE